MNDSSDPPVITEDPPEEQPTDEPANAETMLRGVIDELQNIVDSSPGSPLADKVEDAVAKAETALGELAKDPPDKPAAAGNIEGAIGDLEAAIADGLLEYGYGNQLIDRLAGVASQL